METIQRYRIPGPREDNLGDKLADKLRPAGPDWRQFCLQDFGPREDNLGDKLADKLGDNLGPEARIGDNSALQDSGGLGGQSGRQIGGQTEARRPGLETILRYRISGHRMQGPSLRVRVMLVHTFREPTFEGLRRWPIASWDAAASAAAHVSLAMAP